MDLARVKVCNTLSYSEIILLIAIMVCVMVWGCMVVNDPLPVDQTFMLVVADHLKDGQVLYRDIWDNNAPGNFILYYYAVLIFGNSPRSVYFLDIAFRLITLLFFYLLVRQVEGKRTGLIAAAIFGTISTLYWSNNHTASEKDIFMTTFLVIAMYCFLKYRDNLNARRWFSIGALVGIGTLMKPVAISTYVFFVLLAFVECFRKKFARKFITSAAGLSMGLVVPWLPVICYEYLAGGLNDMWGDLILFNLYFGNLPRELGRAEYLAVIERTLHNFLENFGPIYILTIIGLAYVLNNKKLKPYSPLLVWIPFVLLGVVVQRKFYAYHWAVLLAPCIPLIAYGADSMLKALVHSSRHNMRPMLILIAGLGFMFLYEPDWRPYIMWMTLAMGVYLILRQIRPKQIWHGEFWITVTFIILLLGVGTHVRLGPSCVRSWQLIKKAFVGQPPASSYFPNDKGVAAYINAQLLPNEKILVWGWGSAANIYYLSGRKAPSTFLYDLPLNFSYPGGNEPAYFRNYKARNRVRFIKDISDEPPALIAVVTNDREWIFNDSKTELESFPELKQFINGNYRLVKSIQGKEIYLLVSRARE